MFSKSVNYKFSLLRLSLIFSLLLISSKGIARDPDENNHAPETETHDTAHAAEATGHEAHDGKFNPGHQIMEHIADAHSWHVAGSFHVNLPVILYTDKGLEVFSAGVFYDEATHTYTKSYQGNYNYRLEDEKIEIVNAAGMPDHEAMHHLYDLSITKNVLTIFVVVTIMILVFMSVAKAYRRRPGQAPRGLQSFMEPLIIFIRDDVAKPAIGHKYERFMPYLLTVFFFIWISNLLGLVPFIPGGANMTGNIAITLVLATLTFVITTVNGNGHYWRHIFAMPGVPAWVLVLLTPIEILGVFLRPFVLMIRLFANITAGHIIALAFYSLIFIFSGAHQTADHHWEAESAAGGFGVGVGAWLFTVFMMFLELLVAFLQAYVFTLLSAIYIGSAVEEHHHEEHAHEDAHAH